MGSFQQTNVFWEAKITQKIAEIQHKKIFIVCDHFLEKTPLLEEYVTALSKNNQLTVYADVVPDPPVEKIIAGTKIYAQNDPNLIIAIGGGSAIDTAKAIYYFGQQAELVPPHAFIAVPTTSGTGSEVSSVAVITDSLENTKYPIVDECIRPTEAWLDSRFVMSCPPKVTAYSGLDALTHALEALVANSASPFSDAFASQAIQLIFENLTKCYHENDYYARKRMHQASCLAGLAFQNAGLGISHSISHQLGGQFHLPHGLLNAMLLPKVMQFNSQKKASLKKYANVSRSLNLISPTANDECALAALLKEIAKLTAELHCETTLKEQQIIKEQFANAIPEMVQNTVKDFTYAGNPVTPSTAELIQLMLSVY